MTFWVSKEGHWTSFHFEYMNKFVFFRLKFKKKDISTFSQENDFSDFPFLLPSTHL